MWSSLATFNINESWQLSNQISVNTFRLKHTWVNPYRYSAVAIAALARVGNEGIEIYSPQKIYPKSELEIIQFPSPFRAWNYSLAVKQLTFNSNSITWNLSIDMPSYSLDESTPINQLATSTKNVTTVSVAASVTKILSANSARKGVKFYTADKNKTIYLDTDNVVSAASAIESITPTKPVCVPTILWTGDWYAISPSGTVSIEVEEYI